MNECMNDCLFCLFCSVVFVCLFVRLFVRSFFVCLLVWFRFVSFDMSATRLETRQETTAHTPEPHELLSSDVVPGPQ